MSTLLTGFLIGCAFGAILYLGGATSYRRIMGTLLLRDLWIIKLMATAIGVGTIGIYLLDLGGLAHLSIKPAYIWGIGVGGVIFGAGWAISGYCPGTCVVGTAEGKRDALLTLLGGLTGAFLYSLCYPLLKPLLVEPANFGALTLRDLAGGLDGIYLAAPLGIALLVVAFWALRPRGALNA